MNSCSGSSVLLLPSLRNPVGSVLNSVFTGTLCKNPPFENKDI